MKCQMTVAIGLMLLFWTGWVRADLNLSVVCNQPGLNIPFGECVSLVNLYNITDGDNWNNNSNWGTADVSTWYGVSAFDTLDLKRVWNLDLDNNNLNGFLPGNLNNLTELIFLDLSNNSIFGLITADLGELSH